jgi:hypothetical protein
VPTSIVAFLSALCELPKFQDGDFEVTLQGFNRVMTATVGKGTQLGFGSLLCKVSLVLGFRAHSVLGVHLRLLCYRLRTGAYNAGTFRKLNLSKNI